MFVPIVFLSVTQIDTMASSKELDALAGFSAVARNRAFFETLSASQLTARQSRGPFVYKKVWHCIG
jgi:hypothetical protein